MSSRSTVFEGSTGILTLTQHGKSETYLPDCNMDAARELLLEFQELRDVHGVALKDNYRVGGRNWYPVMVSQLYWYIFFQWVKYRPLVLEMIGGQREFDFQNHGNFRILTRHIDEARGRVPHPSLNALLHQWLWKLNNWILVHRFQADLIFFRFAFQDFRSRDIRRVLDELNVSYLEAVPSNSIGGILRSIMGGERHYYYSQPLNRWSGNRFRRKYNFDCLEEEKRELFKTAIHCVETTLTSCVREEPLHRRWMQLSGAKVFYGFDDMNTYLFPLLFAARSLGLPTIGHQHGAYVKRHAGYMMGGIPSADLEWYDRVIVWGKYWKDKMLRDAPVHPAERWVIGANKVKIPYAPVDAGAALRVPSSVLIPYEFLADSAAVGRYMHRLVELGYTVWFRARVDDDPEAQLDAYLLPQETRSKVQFATGPLDEKFLAGIDIVAGTMTTLVYELLPTNKIIWFLDTPYHHLQDLVEEGLAHHIHLEDLRPPGGMRPEHLTPTRASAEELFGSEPLEVTIKKYIVPHLRP